MASIGKLLEVDVRELWKHEQYDFSNWLAKEANLEYLNDILGLTLTDVDCRFHLTFHFTFTLRLSLSRICFYLDKYVEWDI